MGAARLLAKGWIVFCLFASAHAVARGLLAGLSPVQALAPAGIALFLFGAMGFLFVGGYGVSSGHLWSRLPLMHLTPGFNEIVFVAFACLCFIVQIVYASNHPLGGVPTALETAIRFAVPGQRAIEENLGRCSLDGGRMFAAAFSWLLALIFLGSAISRLRISAALVRLERKRMPEPLGPSGLALALGIAAVAGIQFLFVGTLYALLPCAVLSGLFGTVSIGIAPLMFAYLLAAALINLLAAGPAE